MQINFVETYNSSTKEWRTERREIMTDILPQHDDTQAQVIRAAINLVNDLRRRYPHEDFKSQTTAMWAGPYFRELADALENLKNVE
jgi:hypothetical protein